MWNFVWPSASQCQPYWVWWTQGQACYRAASSVLCPWRSSLPTVSTDLKQLSKTGYWQAACYYEHTWAEAGRKSWWSWAAHGHEIKGSSGLYGLCTILISCMESWEHFLKQYHCSWELLIHHQQCQKFLQLSLPFSIPHHWFFYMILFEHLLPSLFKLSHESKAVPIIWQGWYKICWCGNEHRKLLYPESVHPLGHLAQSCPETGSSNSSWFPRRISFSLHLEIAGIEPQTFCMQSKWTSTEPQHLLRTSPAQ